MKPVARRPACELLPWACECSGQAVSPHPMIFPSTSSWAGIPTLFRGGIPALPADPVADTRPGSRFANREEERPQVFTKLGGSRVRLRPPWTPLAAVTADRRRPLSPLVIFLFPSLRYFTPSFLKCVPDTEGEAGMEAGQAETRDGGAGSNSGLTLMICVQFKVRE